MINLVVWGSEGQMGRLVTETAKSDGGFNIVGRVDIKNPPSAVKNKADVIIDFSRPDSLDAILKFAKAKNAAVILATTGYGEADLKKIRDASHTLTILMSRNMSLGINLLSGLVKSLAEKLGADFDAEIIEKHHNQKADSPSGTALFLAESLNEGYGNSKEFTYGRQGLDTKRKASEIGIHAVRGGTIAGEHEIMFAGKDEIITVTHTALSRQIFATGAVAAAKKITGLPAGLYSMNDIL